MIEYLYEEGEKPCTPTPVKVKLDGKICGEIRKVKGGFQYYPKGQKTGGNIFKSIIEVQQSLEID